MLKTSQKATVQAAKKLLAKKTDCFLILFFWQPLQQPLHTLKDSFCWWYWQLEPLIFHDENMPFISRCISALQGHESWHWLSELLQHSLLMYVYQYSVSIHVHLITYPLFLSRFHWSRCSWLFLVWSWVFSVKSWVSAGGCWFKATPTRPVARIFRRGVTLVFD